MPSSSGYLKVQPPCLKPSAPPGSSITPSSDTNSATVILPMGSSLVGLKLPFNRDDERPELESTSAGVVAIRPRPRRGHVAIPEHHRDPPADRSAGDAEVAT